MEEEKKRNPFFRLVVFLLSLALVLGAVFLVANWRNVNFDYVRRWYAYRSLAKSEDGQAASFSYIGNSNSAFTRVGEDLLVCSDSGIRLYAPDGENYLDQSCSIATPFVSTVDGTSLVYDAGGSELYVYRDRELAWSYTAPDNHSILSASLSAQGLLTMVTQSSGVKAAVTVYSKDFKPVFGLNISSRFVTDAILSPDGKTLALATAGQSGGLYDSRIAFYSLDRAQDQSQSDAAYSLGNDAILKLAWPDGALRVLGESSLTFLSPDGSLVGSYSYARRYLKGFSLDADNTCALLLGQYRAGAAADLVVVDAQGVELASLAMDEQVLSLSAKGQYLSVLTADTLSIYTGALKLYHETTELQGARKALQHTDGSVTLIAGETARLYLPG